MTFVRRGEIWQTWWEWDERSEFAPMIHDLLYWVRVYETARLALGYGVVTIHNGDQ